MIPQCKLSSLIPKLMWSGVKWEGNPGTISSNIFANGKCARCSKWLVYPQQHIRFCNSRPTWCSYPIADVSGKLACSAWLSLTTKKYCESANCKYFCGVDRDGQLILNDTSVRI